MHTKVCMAMDFLDVDPMCTRWHRYNVCTVPQAVKLSNLPSVIFVLWYLHALGPSPPSRFVWSHRCHGIRPLRHHFVVALTGKGEVATPGGPRTARSAGDPERREAYTKLLLVSSAINHKRIIHQVALLVHAPRLHTVLSTSHIWVMTYR